MAISNKLVILAATLAAMLVLTHASFHTTVIEIDDTETTNPQTGRCSRQLRGQYPNHCEQFMMQGMGRQYGRHQQDEEVTNPRGEMGLFDKCCDELEMMEPRCQCEAMKMMMQGMGHMGGSQQSMMMEKAKYIPLMCGTMESKCRMSTM